MQSFNRLSVWDICHYWHGFSPQKSNSENIPLEVETSIRALTLRLSKTLYFKFEVNSIAHNIFYQEHKPIRLLARYFQRKLRKSYSGKSYDKQFLQSLNVGRLSLLKWCQETNLAPPEFWFDPDDPIIKKPVNDDFISLPDDEKRKHGYFALYDLPSTTCQKSSLKPISNADSDLTDIADESKLKQAVSQAISNMNKKNARKRYEGADLIKENFLKYYHQNRNNYKSKADLIREYFSALDYEHKRKIVPTFHERVLDESIEKAVRNLRKLLKD